MPISKNLRTLSQAFVVLCICFLSVLGAMALPNSGRVVVFVSPWADDAKAFQVIARADGEIVNTGRKPWIALGQSDEEGFIYNLYQSGALLVLNADFAAACLPREFFKRSIE